MIMNAMRGNTATVVSRSVIATGLGVAIMIVFGQLTYVPMASLPFVTTLTIVLASPDAATAQPWNIILGHTMSSLAGLVMAAVFGAHDWSAPAAVALALALMHLTQSIHPPAVINAYLAASQPVGWSFLVAPTLSGAVLVTVYAWVFHRIAGNRRWPAPPPDVTPQDRA